MVVLPLARAAAVSTGSTVQVGERGGDDAARDVGEHGVGGAAVARALEAAVACDCLEPHHDQVDARVRRRRAVPRVQQRQRALVQLPHRAPRPPRGLRA